MQAAAHLLFPTPLAGKSKQTLDISNRAGAFFLKDNEARTTTAHLRHLLILVGAFTTGDYKKTDMGVAQN